MTTLTDAKFFDSLPLSGEPTSGQGYVYDGSWFIPTDILSTAYSFIDVQGTTLDPSGLSDTLHLSGRSGVLPVPTSGSDSGGDIVFLEVSGLDQSQMPVLIDVVGGRIDRTSNSGLKWTFKLSNQIRLSNSGTEWVIVSCDSEPTLDLTSADPLGSTAGVVNNSYDIFAEYSGTSGFVLKLAPWAAADTPIGEYSGATTYEIDDRVYGGDSVIYVSISGSHSGQDPSGGGSSYWVSNGTGQTAMSGLYQYDGTWVFANNADGKARRYLGTIYCASASGGLSDSESTRYVWNLYNKERKSLIIDNNSVGTWTCDSTTWRESNNGSGQTRGYFISRESQEISVTIMQSLASGAGGGSPRVSIAYNTTTSGVSTDAAGTNSSLWVSATCTAIVSGTPGYGYITVVERVANTGSGVFYCYSSTMYSCNATVEC